jgi:hypothetical protein
MSVSKNSILPGYARPDCQKNDSDAPSRSDPRGRCAKVRFQREASTATLMRKVRNPPTADGAEVTSSGAGQPLFDPRRKVCSTAAEYHEAHSATRYSITSSATPRSVGGTVMPSIFAVLRLIASVNLVGCMIGRSPGFSPLRMRPT